MNAHDALVDKLWKDVMLNNQFSDRATDKAQAEQEAKAKEAEQNAKEQQRNNAAISTKYEEKLNALLPQYNNNNEDLIERLI